MPTALKMQQSPAMAVLRQISPLRIVQPQRDGIETLPLAPAGTEAQIRQSDPGPTYYSDEPTKPEAQEETPWLMYGAIAAAVGVVGYVVYQKKSRKGRR